MPGLSPMRVHQVVLVPGYGHSSDSGEYERGRVAGALAEVDIINGYLPSLMDELDIEDIRWTILDTRTRPGVRTAARPAAVEPFSLVVHCLAGWSDKTIKNGKNHTQVAYSQESSFQLADELAESIGQWGHCWAHGHKTANPRKVEDALLSVAETKAVAIEPFLLNGPDVDAYVRRLDELGVVVARAIAEHLKTRSQAIRGRPMVSA
jgi:hypothetical protein